VSGHVQHLCVPVGAAASRLPPALTPCRGRWAGRPPTYPSPCPTSRASWALSAPSWCAVCACGGCDSSALAPQPASCLLSGAVSVLCAVRAVCPATACILCALLMCHAAGSRVSTCRLCCCWPGFTGKHREYNIAYIYICIYMRLPCAGGAEAYKLIKHNLRYQVLQRLPCAGAALCRWRSLPCWTPSATACRLST
jgi:hypothetical protein